MNRNFKLIYKLSIILLAVLATLLLSSFILIILRADIIQTFYTIIITPLTRMGHLSEVLVRAVPLCVIALGVAVAYRSGIINIGAEGQMAMGILGFTTVALALPDLPRAVLLPFALLASVLCGGLWGFIPGILKSKLQVSELLSTVMLNYIAAQFYSFCLRVPMLDPAEALSGAGTPQSARLTASIEIGRITGRMHYGIFIALVLAVIVYIFMWKTSFGYKMRASGAQSRAARYGGINVAAYVTTAMVISGAFAGLAGGIEIAAVHRRAIEEQLWLQCSRRCSFRHASSFRYHTGIFLLRASHLRLYAYSQGSRRSGEHSGSNAGAYHNSDRHHPDDSPEQLS